MKQRELRHIGILTSGGDAPGMNACIRAVVRTATARGFEVLGFKRGYAGLLAGDCVRLGPRSVSNVIQHGGTFLGTSRCEEMKTVEGRKIALDVLEKEKVDALVALGGDGTFRGATALAQEGHIRIIGCPCTIDNDVYGTDYTIGFDTAVNTAVESIDKIRDTAMSLERLYFIEVMGRTRGFIALDVGIAGGADHVLVPEVKADLDKLYRDLHQLIHGQKRSGIVVVAEGGCPGGAVEIGRQVGARLGLEYRVCVLGHVQRGGAPTARDRLLASKLGAAAVHALAEGKDGFMVGQVNGRVTYTPLRDTWEKVKDLDAEAMKLVGELAK